MQIHQPLAQNPAAGEHRNLDIFIHPTQHNYGRPQRPNKKNGEHSLYHAHATFAQNAQNPIPKMVRMRCLQCERMSSWCMQVESGSGSGSSCSAVHPRTTSAMQSYSGGVRGYAGSRPSNSRRSQHLTTDMGGEPHACRPSPRQFETPYAHGKTNLAAANSKKAAIYFAGTAAMVRSYGTSPLLPRPC